MEKNEFICYIEKDSEKLSLFKKAQKKYLIQLFDQEVLTKLRNCYYGFISGLLYVYSYPTSESTIGNKMQLLAYIFSDEDYDIVHAYTDSTRNKIINDLSVNSWIEVKKHDKVWVYDTISMMKFEKDVYYQLENPQVIKRFSKQEIESHPGRDDDDDFSQIYDTYLIEMYMPVLENNIKNSCYKEMLESELIRFKQQIDYDNILAELKQEETIRKNTNF